LSKAQQLGCGSKNEAVPSRLGVGKQNKKR